jgi:hypothetical protein
MYTTLDCPELLKTTSMQISSKSVAAERSWNFFGSELLFAI